VEKREEKKLQKNEQVSISSTFFARTFFVGMSFWQLFSTYVRMYVHKKKLPKRHLYGKSVRKTLMKLTVGGTDSWKIYWRKNICLKKTNSKQVSWYNGNHFHFINHFGKA